MANIYPKFLKGLKDKLSSKSIKDGQILYTTDTLEVFIDIDSTRIQLVSQKAGEVNYVEWSDVCSDTKPYGKIPYVQDDGVTEIGKYIDFHIDNEGKKDYDQRITAMSSGFLLSGVTEGNFKGNLNGNATSANSANTANSATTAESANTANSATTATTATSAGIADKVKDSGDSRELTLKLSGDPLGSATYLAAWSGNELRSILASNFMSANAGSVGGGNEDEKPSQLYFKRLTSWTADCWDEKSDIFLLTNYEDFILKYLVLEESTAVGEFTYRIPEEFDYNMFFVFVNCSKSSETSMGSDDQIATWVVYKRYYGDNSKHSFRWQKLNIGLRNDRKNSVGTTADWGFACRALVDINTVAVRIYKGNAAQCWVWVM